MADRKALFDPAAAYVRQFEDWGLLNYIYIPVRYRSTGKEPKNKNNTDNTKGQANDQSEPPKT